MKKYNLTPFLILLFLSPYLLFSQGESKIEFLSGFKNTNHPQIAYWFLTPGVLENDQYLKDLDKMIDQTLFDFIFLDARNGCTFSVIKKMHPVMEKIVTKAHQRHIKIGYRAQVERLSPMPEEVTERFIAEAETLLDLSGKGKCSMNAKLVRSKNSFKKEVFKVFVFKKTSGGFYDAATLKEIKDYDFSVKDQTVNVTINGGRELNGYTAYVMAEFYYNSISNFSPEAVVQAVRFINGYSDIPFDGIMLDEYSNYRIIPPWLMKFKFDNFRLRSYSLAMAKELKIKTGLPAETTLFNMRYAPAGKPEIRIKAINDYMDLMRSGAMHVEDAMYKRAKELYGQNCFIGAHDTFHNTLVCDEIWATGIKWWSIPREYGFSDEKTPLPTQMGIAMSYPANAMYDMYYDSNIKRFATKSMTDLRFGIRTFYHAFNDKQWGIGLENPEAVQAINPVENCARLLNRFNPSLPEIKLLVIFGNEALQNWYPHKSERGAYDINDKLKIEEKCVKIWKAGYRNALVPTDLIAEGKLKLDADNKPELCGHKFDAIIFLYPQYSKEPVLKFLENYVNNGGKLMIEGDATHNFKGERITDRMAAIYQKATIRRFSVNNIPKLGIAQNTISDGCRNGDGSYVFTDIESVQTNRAASFSIHSGDNNYSAAYHGLAAIAVDPQKGLQKFSCAGFRELRKNGQVILSLSHRSDIFVEKKGDTYLIAITDPEGSNKIVVNHL